MCEVCGVGGDVFCCFACNIVAHDECVPELAGVLGVDCDAQKWTVQGANDWELVCPACCEEHEAELAADSDGVVW